MKKRILVIEDDKFIASLLVGVLEKEGFEVDLALDGEDGLRKLEAELPDIILLDLILPGINGFEVLEKLKKGDATRKIPVIIISNLGSEEEIQRGLNLGAAAYLVKANILPEDLIKKIKEFLP